MLDWDHFFLHLHELLLPKARLTNEMVCQMTTIPQKNVIAMIYMQIMRQYSSIQNVFCISKVISDCYFTVPSFETNLS